MSMDRFFTIRFPLKYGRNKTRKLMLIKISVVWLISFLISFPLLVLGYKNPNSLYKQANSICALDHLQFKLYGSIFAFCIPFLIITITYSFTIVSLKKIIKKKELGLQSNKSEKKASFFSNFFFNSEKSSRTNSFGNSENKRKFSFNLPRISRNDCSEISSKKENLLDQLILKASTNESKLSKYRLVRSNSDSKLNKSSKCILICRSESNSVQKCDEKFAKFILKPWDTRMNDKKNLMYKKCKNLCEYKNFGDQKELTISILNYNTKSHKDLNPDHGENATRKNSNVSFGSCSFFEYHNSFNQVTLRKMSQNNSLLSRISGKSKKKSILSSVDFILRSNSLFSSSTKHQVKMYNKQNNEEKALKVLMIIFLMFVLFWSPFFIVNIASVLFPSYSFLNNDQLILSITWLGYASSMINPIIYTMFNKCFRKAFLNLLKCRTKVQYQFKRQNILKSKNMNHDSTKNSKVFV